jgi:hypothetical protein
VFEALDRFGILRNGDGRKRTGLLPFGFDYPDHKLVKNGAEQAAIRPTKQNRIWQANTVRGILARACQSSNRAPSTRVSLRSPSGAAACQRALTSILGAGKNAGAYAVLYRLGPNNRMGHPDPSVIRVCASVRTSGVNPSED